MKEKLVLIGGGGHTKSCIDVIQEEGRFDIVGIVENPGFQAPGIGSQVLGYQVIGTDDDLPVLANTYGNFLITVGQITQPDTRIRLFEKLRMLGGRFPVIISPHAYVSPTALVGPGTIVMHHAVINTEARVGMNCIVNTGALIEHEAVTGDHCHISTYAVLNGQCAVGSRTFIGSHAVLSNNISIPGDTVISAGSVVLRSIEIPGTYIGNPLQKKQ